MKNKIKKIKRNRKPADSKQSRFAKIQNRELESISKPQNPTTNFKRSGSGMGPNGQVWLYGIHTVKAALSNPNRKKYHLLINESSPDLLTSNNDEIKTEFVPRQKIDSILSSDAVHQGIALLVAPLKYEPLDAICQSSGQNTVVVILDQITDPRNIGAILRSASAFNVACVVIPNKYTPQMTATLAKSASGALDQIPIVNSTNISRTIDTLKKSDFWVVGLDSGSKQNFSETNINGKIALVLGAEGSGLRRLTREKCDFLVNIPINPRIGSLNVSTSAAIAFYEISNTHKMSSLT